MGNLLSGKNCIVTGGSRGIGKCIAEAFAKEGANVMITYNLNQKAASETIEMIKKYGVEAAAVQANVSIAEDVKASMDYFRNMFGSLDVLVNNAGAIGKEKSITELSEEEWDSIINTDVKGVFLNIKYAVPNFRKGSVGKIINISSELSVKGRARYVHYTAAKGAVNAMTRSLALELSPDILVNTLAPGPIETDMILKDMKSEWVEKEKQIPLKRLGKVSEIAGTAVLLASSYGDFYCGQFISPNGGAVFI